MRSTGAANQGALPGSWGGVVDGARAPEFPGSCRRPAQPTLRRAAGTRELGDADVALRPSQGRCTCPTSRAPGPPASAHQRPAHLSASGHAQARTALIGHAPDHAVVGPAPSNARLWQCPIPNKVPPQKGSAPSRATPLARSPHRKARP
jgi:hypothetical protein